ncbi:MAG: cupin domain-containing protein [Bacillota bacterium]|jgi:predicted cupin superfamily sugar epimerase
MNLKQDLSAAAMKRHAEGGFYRETYRRDGAVSHIFYLLPAGERAAWHKVRSDELWLFHHGGPLTLTLGGTGETPAETAAVTLSEENLSCLVPANTWQTAFAPAGDAVVSCVMSPAFEWDEWTLYKEDGSL